MTSKSCIPDDARAELKKDYLTVQDFLERGKNETNENETIQVKSFYSWNSAAMEILEEMQHVLLGFVDNEEQKESEAALMLAIIYLTQATTAAGIDPKTNTPDEAEKYSIEKAIENVNKCIDILSKYDINSNTVIPMISALHQQGYFLLEKMEIDKAKKYIEQAESVYNDFKSSQHSEPVSMSSIFGITDLQKPLAKDTLEELHMGTFYYFTQLYGVIGSVDKTVIYCFITIKKQSENNDIDTIDWALGYWGIKLCNIFAKTTDFNFQNARRWLAGATCILEKYEEILKELSAKEPMNDNEHAILDLKWKNLKQEKARISRYWAKYGLLLMSMSKELLIKKVNIEQEPSNEQVESEVQINQEYLGNLKLDDIKNDMERFVNSITDKYILDFNDAKPVFIKACKWLNDAKSYYTLENHLSEYAKIILEMAELYRALIFYEKDKDRQAKMYKRRIDLLEGIVKELHDRQHSYTTNKHFIFLHADIGYSYSEILNIKLDRSETIDEIPTPQILSKINNLAKSAILNYTKFINLLKTPNSEEYPEELVRCALVAYFQLGSLYRKLIVCDRQKSLDSYKYIVKYCKKYPKAAELVPEEFSFCLQLMDELEITF